MFNFLNNFDLSGSKGARQNDLCNLFQVDSPDLDLDNISDKLFTDDENDGFFEISKSKGSDANNEFMKYTLNVGHYKTPLNNIINNNNNNDRLLTVNSSSSVNKTQNNRLNKSPENLILKNENFDQHTRHNFKVNCKFVNNVQQPSPLIAGTINQSHPFKRPLDPPPNQYPSFDNETPTISSNDIPMRPFKTNINNNDVDNKKKFDEGLFNFVLGTMARKSKSSIFHKTLSVDNKKIKRKFPGPAGTLPKLNHGQSIDDIDVHLEETGAINNVASSSSSPTSTCNNHNSNNNATTMQCTQQQSQLLTTSQLNDKCSFSSDLWTTAISDLDDVCPALFDVLDRFSLSTIYKRVKMDLLPNWKVPVVCAMVETITKHFNDATLVLRDPSGTLQGALHRKIIDDYADKIHVGCVIVMKQVAVYYPKYGRNCYLNLTSNNLVRIYSRPLDMSVYVPGHIPTFTNGLAVTKIQDDNFSELMALIETIIKSAEYNGTVSDDLNETNLLVSGCGPNNSLNVNNNWDNEFKNQGCKPTKLNSMASNFSLNYNNNNNYNNINNPNYNKTNNNNHYNNQNANYNKTNNNQNMIYNFNKIVNDNNNRDNTDFDNCGNYYDAPPEILDDWILQDDIDNINLNDFKNNSQESEHDTDCDDDGGATDKGTIENSNGNVDANITHTDSKVINTTNQNIQKCETNVKIDNRVQDCKGYNDMKDMDGSLLSECNFDIGNINSDDDEDGGDYNNNNNVKQAMNITKNSDVPKIDPQLRKEPSLTSLQHLIDKSPIKFNTSAINQNAPVSEIGVNNSTKHKSDEFESSSGKAKSFNKKPKFVVPLLKRPTRSPNKEQANKPLNTSNATCSSDNQLQTTKTNFIFNKKKDSTSTGTLTQDMTQNSNFLGTFSKSQSLFETQTSMITGPPSPHIQNNLSPLVPSGSNFLDKVIPINSPADKNIGCKAVKNDVEGDVDELLDGLESEFMEDFY